MENGIYILAAHGIKGRTALSERDDYYFTNLCHPKKTMKNRRSGSLFQTIAITT